MVKLSYDDTRLLLNLLTPLKGLNSFDRREAAMLIAGLGHLLPKVQLEGPSAAVIPNLVEYLAQFGRVSYDHEALGRFLTALKDFVGLEGQPLLDDLLQRYQMMTVSAPAPVLSADAMPVTGEDVQERIIGENTLQPIGYLHQALRAAAAVAYIEVNPPKKKPWCGTGFLISDDLLLTNHHVLPDAALLPYTLFRFNYQTDVADNAEPFQDYRAAAGGLFKTNSALDYTLAQLGDAPGKAWGWLRLQAEIPEINSRINIIQHPNGLPKQVAMQNNFVQFANAHKIQYVTSTRRGSSGSPALNNDWAAVGLHHAGGNLPETDDGPLYFRNEGIAIGAILRDLPNEVKERLMRG